MTGTQNKAFLAKIKAEEKALILSEIARYYRTDVATIEAEVTGDEAESIYEYMIGSARAMAYELTLKHGFIG